MHPWARERGGKHLKMGSSHCSEGFGWFKLQSAPPNHFPPPKKAGSHSPLGQADSFVDLLPFLPKILGDPEPVLQEPRGRLQPNTPPTTPSLETPVPNHVPHPVTGSQAPSKPLSPVVSPTLSWGHTHPRAHGGNPGHAATIQLVPGDTRGAPGSPGGSHPAAGCTSVLSASRQSALRGW